MSKKSAIALATTVGLGNVSGMAMLPPPLPTTVMAGDYPALQLSDAYVDNARYTPKGFRGVGSPDFWYDYPHLKDYDVNGKSIRGRGVVSTPKWKEYYDNFKEWRKNGQVGPKPEPPQTLSNSPSSYPDKYGVESDKTWENWKPDDGELGNVSGMAMLPPPLPTTVMAGDYPALQLSDAYVDNARYTPKGFRGVGSPDFWYDYPHLKDYDVNGKSIRGRGVVSTPKWKEYYDNFKEWRKNGQVGPKPEPPQTLSNSPSSYPDKYGVESDKTWENWKPDDTPVGTYKDQSEVRIGPVAGGKQTKKKQKKNRRTSHRKRRTSHRKRRTSRKK